MVMANGQGELLASVAGGPGNYQQLGVDNLGTLIQELLEQIRPSTRPTMLCAGVAGAGRAPEQLVLQGHLETRGLVGRALVVSDARAALEGAHTGSAGIVCIAGTGSMVLGRNAAGQEARAGGWGPTLGDEGSAYALMMAGIRMALRAVDGSGRGTCLQQDLLAALELSDWNDIIGAVYGGELSRERIAAACPVLFSAARAGDVVAVDVIACGGRALGAQVAAVARRLDLGASPAVACAGGVFAELDALRGPLAAGAGDMTLELRRPDLPACLGALLLALSTAGVRIHAPVTSGWTGHLAGTGPLAGPGHTNLD